MEFREREIPIGERRRKKEISIAAKEGEIGPPHRFEMEYEEIRPGVWQKVPGSERDLGPISEEEWKEFKEKKAEEEKES